MSEEGSFRQSIARRTSPLNEEILLSYRMAGSGGHVFCLIPSVGRDSSDLEDLALALVKAGNTVLLPEPRGLAGSTGPLSDLILEDLALDVAAVIDVVALGPVILAGHAFGGMVAGLLAELRPDLIVGLVLLAYGGPDYPKILGKMIDRVSSGIAEEDEARAILKQTFFWGDNGLDEWLSGWNVGVIASQRSARLRTGITEGWGGQEIPVLDLMADADPFRPIETAGHIRVRLGNRVTMRRIKEARHGLPAEKPQDTAVEILDWLNGLHSAPPQTPTSDEPVL